MIRREDILSMEYLKKTEYTGSYQGMRYRLEGEADEEGNKRLKVTIWPGPYSFGKTVPEQKTSAFFDFAEEGIVASVEWMNQRFEEKKEMWDKAGCVW